jgi:P4 family phage/plasmid primase-like protien
MSNVPLTEVLKNVDKFLERVDLTPKDVYEYWTDYVNEVFKNLPHKGRNEAYESITKELQELIYELNEFSDDSDDAPELKPVEFMELSQKERAYNSILNSLTGLDYDVAKAFYTLYPDRYKFWSADVKSYWLTYDAEKHKWVYGADRHLSVELSEIFHKSYENLITSFQDYAKTLDDDNAKLSVQNQIKQAKAVMLKLRKTTFKNSVIKELSNLYYDDEIMNKMDSNIKLIGFTNGVYDLEADCFRDGRPSDYLTMSVGYDYDPNPSNIEEVENYFKQIMLEDEGEEAIEANKSTYLLDVFGSCLEGENTNEIALCLAGTGSNSKGKLMMLLRLVFGEYAYNLQSSLLTKEFEADKASSQLFNSRKCRISFISEPSKGIHSETFKTLTGRDPINMRTLFQSAIESVPHWTMVMMFNEAPKFQDNSEGISRRLRVVNFNAKFIDEERTQPFHRKKDPKLMDKFPDWKQATMFILLKHYRKWKQNNYVLITPEEVKDTSRDVLEVEGCAYLKWYSEKVEDKKDGYMTLKDASDSCESWFKTQTDVTLKIPTFSKKDFKDKISGKIGVQPYGQKKVNGKNEKNVWLNVTLK